MAIAASTELPHHATESVDIESAPPPPTGAARPNPFTLRRLLVFAFVAMVVLLARPTMHHVKAAELLVRFGDPGKAPPAGVHERVLMVPTPSGDVRARMYTRGGDESLPAVVLVQGMHRKGIDEERLQRFARSVADVGYQVVTPEVRELSDYKMDAHSVDTVGATVNWLAGEKNKKVGVMGMSFGGGIALVTAADPRFADHVSLVVAVGAHDDLARVARYFVTKEIKDPNGALVPIPPHSYGAMILARTYADRFFPAADVEIAREAMKTQLWENPAGARELAKTLPPESQKKLMKMLDGDFEDARGTIVELVDQHEAELAKVSPHSHMNGLRAPAFLLHGAKDNVIPASETMHLTRNIPEARLGGVVITHAIRHVEMEGEPTLAQKWELVHWMGEVLGAAS